MSATKVCNTCGEEQPLAKFYRRADSMDGHHGRCKNCDCTRPREPVPAAALPDLDVSAVEPPELASDREALGAALVLLDRTEHALCSGLADIRGVIAELERLDHIGKTRFDALTAADLAWFNAHPLKPWGDAVPALVRWLNDRIGGDQ